MAKQTKKHDEEVLFDLMEAGNSTQNFVEKNQTWIIIVVAGILSLVGLFFAYKMIWMAPKETKAITEMYKAEFQFEQDSFALALENPGEGYMGFIDIADNYSMTKAGNLANYYAGISYLRLGRFEAAISYLNDFDPTGKVTPILKHGALGDAYGELGQMDKATSAHKKAINAEDNELMSPYYMYKLAMLYRSQKNQEESMKYFKKLKTEYPNSTQANDSAKYFAD